MDKRINIKQKDRPKGYPTTELRVPRVFDEELSKEGCILVFTCACGQELVIYPQIDHGKDLAMVYKCKGSDVPRVSTITCDSCGRDSKLTFKFRSQ